EAIVPGNIARVKWNAEIVKEEPGYLIRWQSIPNSMINNAGKVTFHDALGGDGTDVEVVMTYHPPAGELGAGIAKMLTPVFEKMIRQDVMNFKDYIETKYKSAANTDGNSNNTANTNDNPNILRSENESVRDGSGSQYANQ
ncbi:MAG TPA: SRPBCC family protein, partial [Flavisolibacter sp.]|nr:SRPBCC family protein [Flavisolibacter sp.]